MKRTFAVLALLVVMGGGSLSAQTRVSVSVSFGTPFVAYHPRPYVYGYRYHNYRYRRYVVYDPRPTIVVVRPYRPARVFVVRGRSRHRHHR
jgi:hypothetical protein